MTINIDEVVAHHARTAALANYRWLAIFGAGGHAKVIADIVHAQLEFSLAAHQGELPAGGARPWRIAGFFDDDPSRQGEFFYGYPILGGREHLVRLLERPTGDDETPTLEGAFVAVGNNTFRATFGAQIRAAGHHTPSFVHPSAIIAPSVAIGDGAVIMAGAVINADASIGDDVIVNTRASIDHDCVLEFGAHVAPGVALCGGVQIGQRVLVGVGASVIPGRSVGADSIVGAGAAVVSDIPPRSLALGVPAHATPHARPVGPDREAPN